MTLHTKLSYYKSSLRTAGFCFLPFKLGTAAFLLVLAEMIGIVEELPGTYKGTDTKIG